MKMISWSAFFITFLWFVGNPASVASLFWNGVAGSKEEDGFLFPSLLSRALTVGGDFDSFNDIFQNVTFRLPDPEKHISLMGPTTVSLSNLYCRGLHIGDMVTNDTLDVGNTKLTFNLDMFNFSMSCFGDYEYDFGIIDNAGSFQVKAENNHLHVALVFQSSTTFDQAPPNQTMVTHCPGIIRIAELKFSSGIECVIASIFEDTVSNLISTEAAKGALPHRVSSKIGSMSVLRY